MKNIRPDFFHIGYGRATLRLYRKKIFKKSSEINLLNNSQEWIIKSSYKKSDLANNYKKNDKKKIYILRKDFQETNLGIFTN